MGPKAILNDFRNNLPVMRQTARNLPKIIKHLSQQAAGKNTNNIQLIELPQKLAQQQQQQFFIGLGITSISSSILIYYLASLSWFAYPLLLIGVISLYKGKPK